MFKLLICVVIYYFIFNRVVLTLCMYKQQQISFYRIRNEEIYQSRGVIYMRKIRKIGEHSNVSMDMTMMSSIDSTIEPSLEM